MNRSLLLGFALGVCAALAAVYALTASNAPPSFAAGGAPEAKGEARTYDNTLTPIKDAKPLLADFPEFVQPVVELKRYEAPRLVDDANADLEVRAWRWS